MERVLKGADLKRRIEPDEFDFQESYFQWLVRLIDRPMWSGGRSWEKLFRLLHETEFIYMMDMDANRADDGIELRYRYTYEHGYDHLMDVYFVEKPCSVLEMMIALANRCEEHIMGDPDSGDRTGKWFFEMINSLGLSDMDDGHFDELLVQGAIDRFLYREYDRDGQGGLFTVHNCRFNLRTAEIWYQMMWYLNEFINGGE